MNGVWKISEVMKEIKDVKDGDYILIYWIDRFGDGGYLFDSVARVSRGVTWLHGHKYIEFKRPCHDGSFKKHRMYDHDGLKIGVLEFKWVKKGKK